MTSSIIFSILKNRFKQETFVLILRLLTLSAGLFCFLFVFNWLKSQYQLDGYNSKSEKLYRVIA
jgi:biotin transporter BioY